MTAPPFRKHPRLPYRLPRVLLFFDKSSRVLESLIAASSVQNMMQFITFRMSYSSPSGLILLAIFSFVASQSSNLVCYDTNGVQTTSVPCLTNSSEGPCCSPGWICLSNGLCEPGPNVTNYGDTSFYRSDCTNPYWNTSACFSGCNNCTYQDHIRIVRRPIFRTF